MLSDFQMNQRPSLAAEPVADAADWRGPEVKSRDGCVYQLDEADIADLESALARVEWPALNRISVTRDQFPLTRTADKLHAVKRQLNEGLGSSTIRGLPNDRYTRQQTATIHRGIGLHIREPVPQTVWAICSGTSSTSVAAMPAYTWLLELSVTTTTFRSSAMYVPLVA